MRADDLGDVAIAGMYAVVMSCAKAGETMPESMVRFRAISEESENLLRIFWDQLRSQ